MMNRYFLLMSSIFLCSALGCSDNNSPADQPDASPSPDMSFTQPDASDLSTDVDSMDAQEDLPVEDMLTIPDMSDSSDSSEMVDEAQDTSVSLCALNEYVTQNTCAPCAEGSVNEADDDPAGPDTTCVDARAST